MEFDGITLVTGAAGFLGRHLAERLAKSGVPLRAAVRPEEDASFLRALGAEVVRADLRDPETLTPPSRARMPMFDLPLKAVWMAVKPASEVSQTISNSMEPSLRAAAVARQPLLARVVTSASDDSRFSVTSLQLVSSVQLPGTIGVSLPAALK